MTSVRKEPNLQSSPTMSASERTRVEVPIGARGFMGVEAIVGDDDLSGPLFAVNLLDRRRPWAYELYGLLVIRSVLKSGARVLFKGHRQRVLLGDPADSRETLLIVRYPRVEAFLNMVRRPYFAVMSIFRRVGLGDFRFGFARSLPGDLEVPARPRPYSGDSSYLLTTFRGGDPQLSKALLEPEDGSIPRAFFAGKTVGTVCVRAPEGTEAQPAKTAPPLGWDGVLLHEGREEDLEELARGRLADLLADAEGASCVLYRRKI